MQNLFTEVLAGIIIVLFSGFFSHINRKIKKILQKIDLVMIEQQSTDYALEKSMGNGYSKHKGSKRQELIEQSEFINKS